MRIAKLLTATLTLACAANATAGERIADIVLLRQDTDLQAVLKDWQPTLDLIEKATGKKAKILVNKDGEVLRQAVKNGEVDLLIDSVYNLATMDSGGNLAPTLTVWKKGKEEYNGCLFAKADSAIGKPADLVGKKVASEDPYSTSSFALPMGMIVDAVKIDGIKSMELTQKVKASGGKPALAVFKETAADPKKVNFAFSGGDENTALWVTTGAADAGAAQCGSFDEKKYKVIGSSAKVPRMVVAFHKKFDAGLRAKIEDAMVALPESDPVLVKIGKAKKIEKIKPNHVEAINKELPNFKQFVKISDAE
jgi:phosphonate transport system substrate-binding protein